jgi:ketosteroid isomerase-like protein
MNDTTAMSPQLDSSFLEEWGRRFGDAWNDHDPDAVVSLCTEDVVWNDAALPNGPAHGRQAVRDFAAFTFASFPDFHVEETDTVYISPIEPLALCPYRMTGTSSGSREAGIAPGQASFSLNGIDQWTFRGELLCHYVTYYDYAEMIRQLGRAQQA